MTGRMLHIIPGAISVESLDSGCLIYNSAN